MKEKEREKLRSNDNREGSLSTIANTNCRNYHTILVELQYVAYQLTLHQQLRKFYLRKCM